MRQSRLRHFLHKIKKPSISPTETNSLVTARERLWKTISNRDSPDAKVLVAFATRYYTLMSILNGRIREKQQITTSLANVDIIWTNDRFRIATIRPTSQNEEYDISLYEYDYMAQIGIAVSTSINQVLFEQESGEFLCHIVDGQGDIVCLITISDGHDDVDYFVNFFSDVANLLKKTASWGMTCTLSREFNNIEQLASMYFETRQDHDLLMDANIPGEIWAAERHINLMDDNAKQAESIWWIEPMRQYVMSHYSNPDLNISFLANKFGLSPAYTGRKFREVTGIGLLELIHRCRLTELDRLVSNGSKVKDAIPTVGYSNWLTMQRARERYNHD